MLNQQTNSTLISLKSRYQSNIKLLLLPTKIKYKKDHNFAADIVYTNGIISKSK